MLQWPSNAGSAVQAAAADEGAMTFEAKMCRRFIFSSSCNISGCLFRETRKYALCGPSACLLAAGDGEKHGAGWLASEAIRRRSEDRDYALKILF